MIHYVTKPVRRLWHNFVILGQGKGIFLGLPALAGGSEKQAAS
jgi:hypothetical protein